ncbi:hypothetical protein BDF21DRAFT_492567 [Thamnidium elegans]|nr:hypothetical protein BDF21DRAFT_492567 [Thamnidium elegans]
MNNNQLVTNIINYIELLNLSKTPCVAVWRPFFITKCIDWCLSIETELSVLSSEECLQVCRQAEENCKQPVPSVSQLLDALHFFFYTLLKNQFLSNSLYLHIIKNYRFLTIPDEDILIKDISELSTNAATDNILHDIIHELS